MHIQISWGSTNVIKVEAEDSELHSVARFIAEQCELSGKERIEFTITLTPTMRKLFDAHLSRMRFVLVELGTAAVGTVSKAVIEHRLVFHRTMSVPSFS